ncbi:hypothetical protein A9Q99_18660 [Gammaproteobacteria bacterium 45_16_T64]|nr:hypothetical protein A9Q99_18660 [Gammaproteobacteria bacterium 45_16_T64]
MHYKSALLSSLLMVSGSVFAGAGTTTLNIGGGVMVFDDDRSLDNGTVGVVGLEYGITDHIAVELSGLTSAPDIDSGDGHVDVSEVRVDGLYYLLTDGVILPYLAGGVGRGEFDGDSADFHETQFNLGGGARIVVNDIFSLRLDLRGIHGNHDNDNDGVFTVGMSWTFGGLDSSSKSDVAPREPIRSTPIVKATPVLDSDGDGVVDANDQCPNTVAGSIVDNKGCVKEVVKKVVEKTVAEKPKEVVVETITLNIEFPTNSSVVGSQFIGELEKVATFLQKHADVSVNIEGHSDDRGKDSYNKALSQRRAGAVKAKIVQQFGVAESRIKAIGYGEERPIASNDTAKGRQKNRRVVAVIKK